MDVSGRSLDLQQSPDRWRRVICDCVWWSLRRLFVDNTLLLILVLVSWSRGVSGRLRC